MKTIHFLSMSRFDERCDCIARLLGVLPRKLDLDRLNSLGDYLAAVANCALADAIQFLAAGDRSERAVRALVEKGLVS